MLGKSNFDLFDEKVARVFQVVDERASSSDAPIIEEEVVPRADGIRYFLSVKALLRDASEKPYAIFGISTDITDRKRAEAERQAALHREQRAREETEALFAVARALASERDLEKVVHHVTDAATRLVGAEFGAFFRHVVDESGKSMLLFSLSGASRDAFEKFGTPRATALFDPIFRGSGPVRSGDIKQDPRYGLSAPHYGMPAGHLPVTSYLAVPVISRSGKVLGGLFFGHVKPDVFDERAERIAIGIAAQAAVAVDNVTLYTHLEESTRRLGSQLNQLHLLAKITRAIGEHQQLACIFDVVVRSLEEELPSDFACVCTHDSESDDFVVRQVSAKPQALRDGAGIPEGTRVHIAEGSLSRCLLGELVYLPDTSSLQDACSRALHACGLNAVVFSPLMFEKRLLGIVVVGRAAANSVSRSETDFFEQLCEHIALAVQHTELFANLQRAYDDLRASQQTMLQQERLRSLGQLASGIAHDINNAISPASVYVDSILEHDHTLSPRTREQLVTVQRAVGDVSQTVARMRGFHRAAESSDGLRPLEPGRLVEEVMELTRPRWTNIPQQKGVVITLDQQIDKNLPTIIGAENEIRDSLTNLIFNAVDAMPEGGTLRLRAYSTNPPADSAGDSRKVVLEVADTGVGMDAATKDRCLEPFFSTKGERGSGLGLAMVYGMSQRHGAELEIESQVGRGTCIRLRFIARSAKSGNGAYHPQRVGVGRPLRVLVIDDDPRVLASLSDVLMSEGHSVEVALGGQAGIDQFRATRPSSTAFDAVITDLGMPHVDGRRVALEIRRVNARTPVILLTGWGQRLRDEGDVPEGVSRVLSKPARLQELRMALDELVTK